GDLNPTPPFTLDCWVQPTWIADDKNVHAVVVTTNLDPMANTGYALFCDDQNFWTAVVGIGPGPTGGFVATTPAPGSKAVVPGTKQIFYLAMTFDGMDLSLFVSVAGAPFNPAPFATAKVVAPSKFVPSLNVPPLSIGLGRPDLPTGQFPFMGHIQNVAF